MFMQLNQLLSKSLLIGFIPILFGVHHVTAQDVSGKVMDSGTKETLPGVNVVIKGTSNGTATDMDGNFSLEAQSSDSLIFSFLGYRSQTLAVGNQNTMTVFLMEDAKLLDQLVVVGYGSVKKKELTGATSTVDGEELTKLNIPRMDAALQGQVAGVTINTNSGSPGGASAIRIRGLSTFGDNDPLILVDGIVYDSEGLNALNPNDIASINVLKDATAGIYGVRAANGVILIETKKGKIGAGPKVEVSGFFGSQTTSNELDLLNASEYAVVKNNAFANGGMPPPFETTNLGEGTNWQDEVFQSAPIQSYNISVSGGSDKTTYSIGGSYFDQQGIVGGEKANFERYNGRVNISTAISDRIQFNSVLLYTNEARSTLEENGIGSVLYNTINAYPTEPVRQADGSYSYLELVNDIINPLAQMENTFNEAYANKFVGKEEIVADLGDHFQWTNRFNFNYAAVEGKTFSPLVWYGPGKAPNTALNENLDPPLVEIADSTFLERGASVYENRDSYIDLTFESFLNYGRTFNELHAVKATFGVSSFTRRGEGLNATAFNIPNNSEEFADISANQAAQGYLNNAGSFQYQERLLSAFFRGEYKYDDRYLISGIIRRDGSSKFGENERWGIFPTVSAAWIISEEEFFNSRVIDFAKLRVSYGVSGNDQIPNFAYRALLDGEGTYVLDNIIQTGVAIGRASNPDLKWETTNQFNVGLDLYLFDDFTVSTNYFIKNTQDLLFQPDVSGLLGTYGPGGFPPFVNAGDVRNQGFELELGYTTKPVNNFIFSASLNGTYIKNEVLEVPDGVEFIPGAGFGVGGTVATRFEEGFPIGYFIGYETDGIFQTQAEIDNAAVVQAGAKPGDLRFVDQNGDGQITFGDDGDRVDLGSPIPDFTFGLNLNGRYKGFDISANFYAAIGQEIIRNFERSQPYANQLGYTLDRWAGQGTSNEIPSVTTGSTRNTEFSDFYVEDGSFLRLRNLQVGYTLPRKLLDKIKVSYLRVYLSANNLWTLTGYSGYDPDIGSFGGPLSAGVDYGFYPQATTIMGGFNIQF
ncbi:MAG: TonB-linked SusC/RagA family outer membrane protein [Cryomorphaceae bacterium]|jgi:TonB-linked SusC/RagA family outer membrane protein